MNKEELIKAMHEAACLPPDDPARREIEETVLREGEWAEKEWLNIIAFDEKLRLEHRKLAVPSDLEETLLDIGLGVAPFQRLPAKQAGRGARWLKFAFAPGLAALLVAVSLIFILNRGASDMDAIVLMAVNDHLNERYVKITAPDAETLRQNLNNEVGFDVRMPRFAGSLRPVGGRVCRMWSRNLAYTLWEGPEAEYSLFQFRLSDFDVRGLGRPELVSAGKCMEKSPCDALAWSEDEYGFILVADKPEQLEHVKSFMNEGGD